MDQRPPQRIPYGCAPYGGPSPNVYPPPISNFQQQQYPPLSNHFYPPSPPWSRSYNFPEAHPNLSSDHEAPSYYPPLTELQSMQASNFASQSYSQHYPPGCPSSQYHNPPTTSQYPPPLPSSSQYPSPMPLLGNGFFSNSQHVPQSSSFSGPSLWQDPHPYSDSFGGDGSSSSQIEPSLQVPTGVLENFPQPYRPDDVSNWSTSITRPYDVSQPHSLDFFGHQSPEIRPPSSQWCTPPTTGIQIGNPTYESNKPPSHPLHESDDGEDFGSDVDIGEEEGGIFVDKPSVDNEQYDYAHEKLEKYGTNLTTIAQKGKLDPVIGRNVEIRRCIEILSRKAKCNPILLGEPGVGKTAILEGLAQRIVKGDVPKCLKYCKVISIDMGNVMSNTKYLGELETKIKEIMDNATTAKRGVLLFFDEIHMIIGAGSTESKKTDVAQLLKPALARGDFLCIGATTLDEYKKFIEDDQALARRFQKVIVNPPSVDDTIAILRGLRNGYELHHGVSIADSALEEAAKLSNRYITDRFLPDKAIDLVDEATSKVKMELTSKPSKLDEIDRTILQLDMERLSLSKNTNQASQEHLNKIMLELESLKTRQRRLNRKWKKEQSITTRIISIKEEIVKAKSTSKFTTAATTQSSIKETHYGFKCLGCDMYPIVGPRFEAVFGSICQVCYRSYPTPLCVEVFNPTMATKPTLQKKPNNSNVADLEVQLIAAEQEWGEYQKAYKPLIRLEVTGIDIAEVLSQRTGIPVAKMQGSEGQKLLQLDRELHKRVVGQDQACKAIARAIQRSRAGLSDPKRPIASFMFMGPTGVGKTELAKALASCLFDAGEEAMVRIDMSEYGDRLSISRLVGAPPGLVGHGDGGQLTEPIRRRPYSVVLFDEIEKAHEEIFNIFLQILDDGRLTDSQGHLINFTNTIIIMTSNVGSDKILNLSGSFTNKEDAYEAMKAEVMDVARAKYRPEFINRIDEYIVFQPLEREQIFDIVQIQLHNVAKRLKDRKINMQVSANALELLSIMGYDPQYGARPVKRVIQQRIEDPLAQGILRGDYTEESTVMVDIESVSTMSTDPHKPPEKRFTYQRLY